MNGDVYKHMFEGSPVAMLLVTKERVICQVNREAELLFGYNRDELIGKPIEVLVPPEARQIHPGLVENYIQSPSPRYMGKGRDLYGIRKDGTRVPIEVGLKPIHSADGLYVMSSIVDITERLRVKRKLEERADELEQFAYRTSHDLRAPLVTMNGLLEFIDTDIRSGNAEEAMQSIEKVSTLTKKLDSLVEDILQLTRSDYLNEGIEAINFKEIISSAREKFEFISSHNKVEIIDELAHKVEFKVQKTRITQVLDNLISNAIKYCDLSKKNRNVTISTRNDEKNFYLKVRDNGLGIPPEKLSEVFGMFKRFHKESGPGSGLGLYLVKKHIQKLEGTITVESVIGEGSTFTITLPIH